MKYYVYLADDNKTICSVSCDKTDNSIEIDTDKPIEDLAFGGYEYVNGELIKNNEKYNEFKSNEIRVLRDEICFPIIDRGKLWYDTLADWQLEELNNWYHAYLDLPNTYAEKKARGEVFNIEDIIPENPKWLK